MGSVQLAHVSEADYLSGEELPGTRHEYVDGQIFAIAGATKTHGTIALNIGVALRAQLRGTPCRAWVADMKVNVATARSYYYPDVVATCADEDLRLDSPQSFVTAPKLIVEVLSPSTAKTDRWKNVSPTANWTVFRSTCWSTRSSSGLRYFAAMRRAGCRKLRRLENRSA